MKMIQHDIPTWVILAVMVALYVATAFWAFVLGFRAGQMQIIGG